MNTKKAYIKIDGEIGEKDQPAIEYVDRRYSDDAEWRRREVENMLTRIEDSAPDGKNTAPSEPADL